jgi:hypothetical protein
MFDIAVSFRRFDCARRRCHYDPQHFGKGRDMAKRRIEEYPELLAIKERLEGGKPDELIAIFIPSHDRKEKELTDQALWAGQGLSLFGELYGGATSFNNLSGVYQPAKHLRPLYDSPIMIQSLTDASRIMEEDSLFKLAAFCQNMGRKTNQASIGVVINNKFIDINIKHDE